MAIEPEVSMALDRQAAEALVRWYLAAGVTYAVDEHPVNRLRQAEPASSPEPSDPSLSSATMGRVATSSSPAAPPVSVSTPAFGGAAELADAEDARRQARSAPDLETLRAVVDGYKGCALRSLATNTVFADGNPKAPLMVIGEAPGAEEDRRGLPFVGASGKLLDAMLHSIGRDRTDTYITNVMPWRPPGNRKPTSEEVALCYPFLERHIALVDPKVIVLLGALAGQTVLATTTGITRLRGHWARYDSPDVPAPIPVLPSFHPAYLLRNPQRKREVWRDLLAIKQQLATLHPIDG